MPGIPGGTWGTLAPVHFPGREGSLGMLSLSYPEMLRIQFGFAIVLVDKWYPQRPDINILRSEPRRFLSSRIECIKIKNRRRTRNKKEN